MKKHRYNIRNISVSKRLFYSFVSMSVIPLIVFAIISYTVSNTAITRKTSAYSSQLLNSVSLNLQNEVRRYTNIADDLMFNDLLQYALSPYNPLSANLNRENPIMTSLVPNVQKTKSPEIFTNYSLWTSAQKSEFFVRMRSSICTKMSNAPYIKDIIVVNNNEQNIYSFGFSQLSNNLIKQCVSLWKKEMPVNWFSIGNSKQDYIVYTHPVKTLDGTDTLGYILTLIHSDAFSNCLSKNFGENSAMMILDQYGKTLASNKDIKLSELSENDLFSRCSEKSGFLHNYEFNSEKSMVIYQKLPEENWILFSFIPNSYLRSEMSGISITTLVLVLVCLLCSLFVYRITWGSITRPINRLVQLLSKASDQNFDHIIINDSQNELNFMYNAFSQIVKKMQEMVAQLEQQQHQKRKCELKMLQAQINPHFLFNALNAIRFTAIMSKANNVTNGLTALSKLLKNTIIDQNEFVTIDDELNNIENYITIQRLRYGDIFSVQYDITEEVRSYYTIKFLLQPIVENSIIHGLNEDISSNIIKIRFRLQDKKLIITITDNGNGFDVTKLNDKFTKQKRISGIGINNVKQRIVLYFGENYHFYVKSEKGQGTTVTMETPVLTKPAVTELQHQKEGYNE